MATKMSFDGREITVKVRKGQGITRLSQAHVNRKRRAKAGEAKHKPKYDSGE